MSVSRMPSSSRGHSAAPSAAVIMRFHDRLLTGHAFVWHILHNRTNPMSLISELQAKFGRGAAVTFEAGPNDVSPVVVLRTANGSCRVLLYAAHVLSWKDASGAERLFLRYALISLQYFYFEIYPDGF